MGMQGHGRVLRNVISSGSLLNRIQLKIVSQLFKALQGTGSSSQRVCLFFHSHDHQEQTCSTKIINSLLLGGEWETELPQMPAPDYGITLTSGKNEHLRVCVSGHPEWFLTREGSAQSLYRGGMMKWEFSVILL